MTLDKTTHFYVKLLFSDLDDDTLDAQALLFLLAGFETSSTLLSFFFYTMAVEPDIQDKLRAHIEEVTNGQELCYDHFSQLDYLEAVVLGKYYIIM